MSEDILERAKKADIDLMAITDWGQLRDLFGELIAEIERLRSENKIISDRAAHHEKQDAAEIELLAARIKELEAEAQEYHDKKEAVLTLYSAQNRDFKRLEAAFLKAEEKVLWDEVVVDGPKDGKAARHIEIVQQKAREELERIKANEKL